MLCPKCKNEIENNRLTCSYCKTKIGSTCKKCGGYNLITAKTCSICGNTLLKICSNCGAANLPEVSTCRKCSNKLVDKENNNLVEIKPIYQGVQSSQQL